ncbi:MAG: sensor histidine kinase [Clostridia bacterium]|nr:sensor histidine kinase [Clostridia bacterium]
MNEKHKRLTLKHMLVRGSLFPTVLPGLLIFLITCVICFRFAIAQGVSYGQELSDIATSLIADRISKAEQLAVDLPSLNATSSANSQNSMYMLVRNSNPPGEMPFPLPYYEHYIDISRLLKTTYLTNNPYINGVYVITRKQRLFSFSQTVNLLPDSDYPMEEYLQYTSGGYVLMAGGMARQFNRSSMARRISTDSLLTLVAPMGSADGPIAVSLIDLNSQLMDISGPQRGSVFLLLGDEVIYASQEDEQARPDVLNVRDGVHYDILRQAVFTRSTISGAYGLTLIMAQPVSPWRMLWNTLPLCALVTALSIVLSVAMTRRHARRISQPVIDLANSMSSSKPLGEAAPDYQGIEEFETLYRQYNAMRSQINHYVEESYAQELAATRMRLQALSSQIDMHFLYNTFECMHSLCLLRGVDDVASMTKALSDMFHYISDNEPLVRVAHEIRHICDYRTIQNMRFRDKFDLLIDVEEELLSREIPRLILQPLVENAYKHGLRSRASGQIVVCGQCEAGLMRFSVQDDGVGMDEAQLALVSERVGRALRGEALAGDDHVGLINIASRLYLRYREQATMSIASEAGRGTRVDITISEGWG